MTRVSKPVLLYAPQATYAFSWGVNSIVVVGADKSDVVFTHEDPKIQTVNVTKLHEAIANGAIHYKKLMAVFDNDNVVEMLKLRDIDPERVKYILSNRELYDSPAIFVGRLPDLTLIDGTHRMYARFHNGEDGMRSYVVTYQTLQRFKVNFWVNGVLIKDTRETILKTFEHNTAVKEGISK